MPPARVILDAAEAADLPALVDWLTWADPNGCHTAEAAIADECDPHTRESALVAVRDMLDGEL